MKNLTKSILAIILLLVLSVTAFAESYTDEMSSADNKENMNYYNLILPSPSTNIGKDKSYIIPTSKGSSPGGVVYNVSGVSEVSVSIYSAKGTFATARPDGSWSLGGSVSGNAISSRYNTADDTVYIHQNGENKVYTIDSLNTGRALFLKSDYSPSGNTVNLGLNILVSSNGQDYKSVTSSLSAVEYFPVSQNSGYYYETYTANIPSNTTHIRLALYDFASIPNNTPGAPRMPNKLKLSLCLAEATFNGKTLSWGGKQPTPPDITDNPNLPNTPDIPSDSNGNIPHDDINDKENSNNNGNHQLSIIAGIVAGAFQKEFSNKDNDISNSVSSSHSHSSSSGNTSKPKTKKDNISNNITENSSNDPPSESAEIIDIPFDESKDDYSTLLSIGSGIYIGLGALLITIIAILRRE